jgi:uncharacterized membrane protein YfcA
MERGVSLIVFVIVGFFAQFIDGTAGMGYGAFSASLLIGMGIMPALASAGIHNMILLRWCRGALLQIYYRDIVERKKSQE